MSGPLSGVRVVEVASVIAGPLASMWLADQGADVVKVEAVHGGDTTRSLASQPELGGMAGLFVNANRGKRSVAVDVSTSAGRDIVLDLCRGADVFLQNWRPGAMDRAGLGYQAVAAVAPEIIYVSVSGFGPDGPYAHRRAYDPIMQGLTGYVAVQCNPEIPFSDLVRTLVCDKATALVVAQAVSAALYARERGRGGQHIEVPMLDSALAFLFPDAYMARSLLDDPKREVRPTIAQTFRVATTGDGHIITHAGTIDQMHRLFRALGHPEWVTDPRFSTAVELRRHFEVIGPMLAAAFEAAATTDLTAALEAEDVPFAPVAQLDEVADNCQVRHNGVMSVREIAPVGRVLEVAHPARFSATPIQQVSPAPRLGEHTDEVLREIGLNDAEIQVLRSMSVVC
jgi:crotonobetainyl-CoA:carnitine CoA-transferase CaiB-like acyl-CoA transferase